jgi:hypothetical protein
VQGRREKGEKGCGQRTSVRTLFVLPVDGGACMTGVSVGDAGSAGMSSFSWRSACDERVDEKKIINKLRNKKRAQIN